MARSAGGIFSSTSTTTAHQGAARSDSATGAGCRAARRRSMTTASPREGRTPGCQGTSVRETAQRVRRGWGMGCQMVRCRG